MGWRSGVDSQSPTPEWKWKAARRSHLREKAVRDFGPLSMTQAELDVFLAGTPPKPCYATVSSLRRDGSPIGVPLGYLYEDGWIYLSMNPETSGTKRILRDPRVCVSVYNDHYPVKFAIITGTAEVYDDPGLQLE
jgi:hypothetical protein